MTPDEAVLHGSRGACDAASGVHSPMTTLDEKGKTMTIKTEVTREPVRGEVVTAVEFGVMPEDQIVPCCASAVHSGGDRCDCWEVELAAPQAPICEGPVNVRRKACVDCAYRTDSVERQRGEEPNPGGGLIFCHWDAPAVTRAVHPPSGHVIDYPPGEVYDPIQHGDRYWKVDGRPQDYCAVSGALTGVRRPVPADGEEAT